MSDELPIGVFDSGVGGLSVMAEIVRQLPHEDILYFADSAHCPYGPRPQKEIQRLSQAIVRFLLGQGAKIIVVACNTASAAALVHLRENFPDVPLVGMVPPVKPAASLTSRGVIGVLATPATFQGALFADVVGKFAEEVELVTQVCPGLVELVERGEVAGPQVEGSLRRYLQPMLERGVDTLVLGCTHYPFLVPTIQRIMGQEVTIIDPAPAVARQTGRVLAEQAVLNPQGRGDRTFFTSGDPLLFARLMKRLLGEQGPVFRVEWQGTTIVVSPEKSTRP